MKKIIYIIPILFCIISFNSCDKINSLFEDNNKDPNVIGGETNLPVTQVGNTITPSSIKIGNNYYDVIESIEIIKNEGGVVTVSVKADLRNEPSLAALNDWLPANYKDANGKIDAEFKYKMTSEGIQDYYKDNKPFTIAKFDCNVGDQYNVNRTDGKTSTRTVFSKSTTDDFPYGFMYIKTIGVEQTANTPGVSKYILYVNHKFGLVNAKIILEDGTSAEVTLYPDNY